MKSKFISSSLCLILLVGCSANGSGSAGTTATTPTPTALKVSPTVGDAILNQANFPSINQDQGKVDFTYSAAIDTPMRMESSAVVTTGCDSGAVKVTYLWGEYDATGTYQVATVITPMATFTALAGHKHDLAVVVQGLSGCTSLSISLVLRATAK